MTIEKIYYVTEAFVSSYSQGTDLLMVKAKSGDIFGLSSEFEICTKDIELVSGQYTPDRPYSQAQWIDFCSEIGTVPAGWADISGTGIAELVVGYRLESDLQVHRFKLK